MHYRLYWTARKLGSWALAFKLGWLRGYRREKEGCEWGHINW